MQFLKATMRFCVIFSGTIGEYKIPFAYSSAGGGALNIANLAFTGVKSPLYTQLFLIKILLNEILKALKLQFLKMHTIANLFLLTLILILVLRHYHQFLVQVWVEKGIIEK
jgi:hypothetical protein